MAENDVRPATATASRPRTAATDVGLWAEPWHFAPRTQGRYWDHATAGWRSRGPIPAPRSGD